jgi:hypothetical protein
MVGNISLATHRRVLDAVAFWRELGAELQLIDEGGYWETRSETALRAKLDEYDRLVAAFGGALKDSGAKVDGAIFSDPRFEQLEAEGQAKFSERKDTVLRNAPELRRRRETH